MGSAAIGVLIAQLILLLGHVSILWAADKNGVSPNTISLPSGPGSIEGLGEAFQPQLNNGTARYGVNIAVPAGVAGHTPGLVLQYDSGRGDGPASLGWTYAPGSISRQTDKGIPRYIDADNGIDDDYDNTIDEADEIDTFVGPDGEELVPFPDNTYRARIEGNFARYRRTVGGWEVDLKSGATLTFGQDAASRITDQSGARVYRWLLVKSEDRNGNVIEYSYASFPESTNQKYLKEIRYGPGAPPWGAFYFIHFKYEDKPDWRKDYRSGFEVKTARRLASIDIGIQGHQPDQCATGDWNDDGTPDALIGRNTLTYDAAGGHIAQLVKITRFGADGVNYLPPTSFAYGTPAPPGTPGTVIDGQRAIIDAENTPETVMDSTLVDLIDLDRDGLPDILKTDFGGGNHTGYRNLGMSPAGGQAIIRWGSAENIGSQDDLAQSLHLAEDRVSLADMNGDGISDLVHTTLASEVVFFPNQGALSWGERRPMSIQETAPPAPFAFDTVMTTDLDFNKRMDVVRSTENGYTAWYNYADGSYSRPVQTPGANSRGRIMLFSDSGFDFTDMNGDRLNDAVRITPTMIIYCASLGYGRYAPAVEIPIPDTVLSDGENGQVGRAKLTDVSGDGLADLVVERAAANELWYWLNLGTDAFSARYTITGMPSQYSPGLAVRWADLNGNGTVDLVYADSTAQPRLRMVDIGELVSGSAYPNLLTRIDNGLGVSTHINYLSSTEHYLAADAANVPWTSTVPFPVQVVSEVVTTTGLDVDVLPGEDQYRKDYVYRDGFYEDRERQFRGFGQVRVVEYGNVTAPDKVTDHAFFTGGPDGEDNDEDGSIDEVSAENHREEDALKGMVRSLEVRAASGTIFNRSENDWRVRNLLVNAEGIEVRFAYKTQTHNIIYEGTETAHTLRTTYLYDDFGNVTEERNYGALAIAGDEVFSFTDYINDTTHWLLGFPQYQSVTDATLNKAAETFSYYDGSDYIGLAQGQITAGRLTRQQGWVAGANYVDLVRNAYDAYGNIVGTLDPNGYRRTIGYDGLLNTYPVSEDIEVGGGSADLTVVATYNLGLGTLTSSLDFNGNQTAYEYDTFGRPTAIIRPGDSSSLPSQSFAYTAADPANDLVYEYDPAGTLTLTSGVSAPSSVATYAREVSGQGGTYDVIQYVDGLGRKLALVEEAETGFAVKEATLFNALGTPQFSFLPYAVASAAYARPAASLPAVETHYDAKGRPVSVFSPPDADGVITSLTNEYLPLGQITTDENGNPKSSFIDGQERLIEVHEVNQDETYITRYGYNALGGLVQVVDAQDNVKTLQYDGLGRRTDLYDPDRGHMGYFYDAAGNLFRTVDNKGQEILYTYDGANRLLSEDYLDAALIEPDVAYHYDTPFQDYPDMANTRGKLAWVEDLSGAAFFSYDPRGNITQLVKRIIDAGTSRDHLIQTRYDAMDRMVSLTWPDGDRIQYQYNNGALLESIPDIVNSIDYTPSDQRQSIRYANGLLTTYAYDPRNRLIGLVTDQAIPSGDPLQDLLYSLDGVGNISAIDDNRTLLTDSPLNATQAFKYDDVYRLTQASGPGYGSIDFQYDKIGNMVFKGSPEAPDPDHIDDPLINLGTITNGGAAGTSGRGVKLPGDPPGPHAVTATASGLVFDYDDNGNMIDHADDTYKWDFKDRLLRTTTVGTVADYVYDHSGQRVVKRAQTGAVRSLTHYVHDSYELRDGKPVKYVFDGSRRLARIEGRLVDDGEATSQVLNLGAGWNFFSLDVEPDDPVIGVVFAALQGNYTDVWAFDAASQQYWGHVPAADLNDLTEIHAGTGYLIHLNTPAIVDIDGNRQVGNVGLEVGWNLIATPADAPISIAEMVQPVAGDVEVVWGLDAASNLWRSYLPAEPDFLGTLETAQPLEAYWLKTSANTQIPYQEQPKSIYFFHPDHLGSSNVVTESNGVALETTEYYPYGRPRHEERTGFESAYKYTGKELDGESGLMYYEARYYEPVVGKFVSVDPLALAARTKVRRISNVTPYTYAADNPLSFVDPTGEKASRATEARLDFLFKIREKYVQKIRVHEARAERRQRDLVSLVNQRLARTERQSAQIRELKSDYVITGTGVVVGVGSLLTGGFGWGVAATLGVAGLVADAAIGDDGPGLLDYSSAGFDLGGELLPESLPIAKSTAGGASAVVGGVNLATIISGAYSVDPAAETYLDRKFRAGMGELREAIEMSRTYQELLDRADNEILQLEP